jgi:CHAD domain-containing protein
MSNIPVSDLGNPELGAEHDEIGPLSVGHDHRGLRTRLLREFRASLDIARLSAANSSNDLATAVHHYRRALRRARALVDVISAKLPKHERKSILEALRDARGALSVARDHAVAPGVLAAMPLGEPERLVANDVLRAARDAAPTEADTELLLREGAARAVAQADALEAALPVFDERVLFAGMANTYRKARRARRGAKRSMSQFHRFRRRLKELAYQFELVAELGGARMQTLKDAYTGISVTCGEVADLHMVREFVATYGGPRNTDALEGLDVALVAQIRDGAIAQRKASRDLFGFRGKKFGKKLARALRKDTAPATGPVEGNDPGDSD